MYRCLFTALKHLGEQSMYQTNFWVVKCGEVLKVLMPIEDSRWIGSLINCHQSQTEGGKEYAKAVQGRMKSNATFFDASSTDKHQNQLFAVNLLPLLENPGLSLLEYANEKLSQFKNEVELSLTPFEKS